LHRVTGVAIAIATDFRVIHDLVQCPSLPRTAVLGYGRVPQDTLSFQVIITIIVGLGVPVLFILIGGIYVIYKKKPWENVSQWVSRTHRRREYSRLN